MFPSHDHLGGVEEINILEANTILKEVIHEDTGIKPTTVFYESRHEVKHAIPTFQKSIDILGFKHKTSLKDGLRKMWEWAKQQPHRDRFVWSEYEIDKGIYSFWKNK